VKRVPVTIDGHITKPVKSHKFLGIITDEELRFKEQLASAVAKGTKYALACRRLAKPSLGVKNKFNCLLFNSIVLPKMLYGVDIWGARMVAELGKRAGRKGQGRVLERVLRTHAITASGAMRTTATDAAVAHADLTPMPFMLQTVCHRAYLRMTTLPPSNPIHREIRLAARQRKRHKSPLHFLVKAFGTHPKITEEILPLRHSPKWEPCVSTLIADSKEDAVQDAGRAAEEIQIFTDGSGYQGGIGAAAVLRRRGKPERVLRYHLGSDKHYMVFNGEQVGMLLGVELLNRERYVCSVYMGVDNQAAIQATTAFSPSSSHSLTDMFLISLDKTIKKHNLDRLSICWVPGHTNIAGNKSVDKEAKKAAEGNSSAVDQLPTLLTRNGAKIVLLYSKAALIQAFNTKLKAKIKADFTSTDRGKRLWRLDPSMPSGKFAALVNNLPRRHASVLMQLRTGHVPLNHHLARIRKIESPACPRCDSQHETVYQFILICPAYRAARQLMEQRIGRRQMRLEHLLANDKSLPHLFHFLNSTKRLQQIFGNLTPPTRGQPDPPRDVVTEE